VAVPAVGRQRVHRDQQIPTTAKVSVITYQVDRLRLQVGSPGPAADQEHRSGGRRDQAPPRHVTYDPHARNRRLAKVVAKVPPLVRRTRLRYKEK